MLSSITQRLTNNYGNRTSNKLFSSLFIDIEQKEPTIERISKLENLIRYFAATSTNETETQKTINQANFLLMVNRFKFNENKEKVNELLEILNNDQHPSFPEFFETCYLASPKDLQTIMKTALSKELFYDLFIYINENPTIYDQTKFGNFIIYFATVNNDKEATEKTIDQIILDCIDDTDTQNIITIMECFSSGTKAALKELEPHITAETKKTILNFLTHLDNIKGYLHLESKSQSIFHAIPGNSYESIRQSVIKEFLDKVPELLRKEGSIMTYKNAKLNLVQDIAKFLVQLLSTIHNMDLRDTSPQKLNMVF